MKNNGKVRDVRSLVCKTVVSRELENGLLAFFLAGELSSKMLFHLFQL